MSEKRTIRHVTVDENGTVIGTSSETVEWKPVKVVHSGLSESAKVILSLKPGDVKRIVHGDLKCEIKTYPKGGRMMSARACSLQPTIYKMRKQGWKLEYYHEADHVMVIRRLV